MNSGWSTFNWLLSIEIKGISEYWQKMEFQHVGVNYFDGILFFPFRWGDRWTDFWNRIIIKWMVAGQLLTGFFPLKLKEFQNIAKELVSLRLSEIFWCNFILPFLIWRWVNSFLKADHNQINGVWSTFNRFVPIEIQGSS